MRPAVFVLIGIFTMQIQTTSSRPRARELGITPGVMEPGPLNAITDIEGVRVGQTTIVEGANVRTGVTAIVPHGGTSFATRYRARSSSAMHSANSQARRRSTS